MPTMQQQIVQLRTEIEKLDRWLDGWRDKSMPAFKGTIKRKQELQLELERLLQLHNAPVPPNGPPATRRRATEREASRFGKNIRRLRNELGWSANQLAEKSGIDKKQVLLHEHGTLPHPKNKALYADTFTKAFTKKKGTHTSITVQDLGK